jgi:hypothetical protein
MLAQRGGAATEEKIRNRIINRKGRKERKSRNRIISRQVAKTLSSELFFYYLCVFAGIIPVMFRAFGFRSAHGDAILRSATANYHE